MRVVLNGEPREAPEGATVADLVAAEGIEPDRSWIAVALNSEVVPRGAWATTPVADGSRIEILQAVAGG